MNDRRYSIRLEYCGYEEPMWVLRFCGEWIDCFESEDEAEEGAATHRQAFLDTIAA